MYVLMCQRMQSLCVHNESYSWALFASNASFLRDMKAFRALRPLRLTDSSKVFSVMHRMYSGSVSTLIFPTWEDSSINFLFQKPDTADVWGDGKCCTTSHRVYLNCWDFQIFLLLVIWCLAREIYGNLPIFQHNWILNKQKLYIWLYSTRHPQLVVINVTVLLIWSIKKWHQNSTIYSLKNKKNFFMLLWCF